MKAQHKLARPRRLTWLVKSALGVVVALVVFLGGEVTAASWIAETAMSSDPVTSGQLTAADPVCDGWVFAGNASAPYLGQPATTIVPGDIVTNTCHLTLTATGDHLTINAAVVAGWANANLLEAGKPLSYAVPVGTYTLTFTDTTTTVATQPVVNQSISTTTPVTTASFTVLSGTYDVTLLLTAAFPYAASGTSISQPATNNANDVSISPSDGTNPVQALLNAITISLTQTQTAANPAN